MIPLKITKKNTVGEIVAEDYRTAEVFKKFGIDFCCGGTKSLEEVCEQKGVDQEALIKALGELDQVSVRGRSLNFNDWDLPFLIDFIINVHHQYVLTKLPQLLQYSRKVARVHGNGFPETITIAEKLNELSQELLSHLEKEEKILFPYVKRLSQIQKEKGKSPVSPFGTVRNPIGVMIAEHDFAGDTMQEIRQLSNNFTPPESACNTYRVLYALLEEFEEDLHQHVHLENNILFPKAITLETDVLSKNISPRP